MEREREREKKKKKKRTVVEGVGSLRFFFFLTLSHYLQLQKFSSSKMNLPRKRLGYDARISSSISQEESPDMRSTKLLPWEYFFHEVVSLVNLKF